MMWGWAEVLSTIAIAGIGVFLVWVVLPCHRCGGNKIHSLLARQWCWCPYAYVREEADGE